MRGVELGSSRFRVRLFEPPRNDGASQRTWLVSPVMTESAFLLINPRGTLDVAGVTMLADLSGALFWEDESLLVVSDLHLEKGSSFATRGVLLPPYDTAATLGPLAPVISPHDT